MSHSQHHVYRAPTELQWRHSRISAGLLTLCDQSLRATTATWRNQVQGPGALGLGGSEVGIISMIEYGRQNGAAEA